MSAVAAQRSARLPLHVTDVILAPRDYARWLGEELDPRDLMRPFPAELMRMWPISTRVNKPENDDASIVEPIELGAVATRERCCRERSSADRASFTCCRTRQRCPTFIPASDIESPLNWCLCARMRRGT